MSGPVPSKASDKPGKGQPKATSKKAAAAPKRLASDPGNRRVSTKKYTQKCIEDVPLCHMKEWLDKMDAVHCNLEEAHEPQNTTALGSRRAMIQALLAVDNFPTTGYQGKSRGDKLHAADDDDFEIFVTNDGDTVWNGKDTDEDVAPEYVHEILQKMQQEAQENDSDDEEGRDEEEDKLPLQDDASLYPVSEVRIPDDADSDSSEEGEANTNQPEPVDPLSNIKAEEKVFLHKLGEVWYVVRPSDNKQVETKYPDPQIQQVKLGDKWVIIVDSRAKAPGSKPRYTDTLLGGRKAEPEIKVEAKPESKSNADHNNESVAADQVEEDAPPDEEVANSAAEASD
eukprot:s3933_g5.t1